MLVKNKRRNLLIVKCLTITAIILSLGFISINNLGTPAFAKKGDVIKTTFFGDIVDDGKGCGVFMILNLIVDILTYGIAIAAAIGIVISGITYLTARGDETKTTKAKRRLFEIVIGLAAYAIMWSILSFLLPGGKLNTNKECKSAYHNSSLISLETKN